MKNKSPEVLSSKDSYTEHLEIKFVFDINLCYLRV